MKVRKLIFLLSIAISTLALNHITVNAECSHANTKQDLSNEHLRTATTCTEGATYYYVCADCGEQLTTYFTAGDPLGHSLGVISYEWSNNNAQCTTKRKCLRCDTWETETVNSTSITHPQTCTVDGRIDYVASFKNSDFRQRTTVTQLKATGHVFTRKAIESTYKRSNANCTNSSTYWYACTVCNKASNCGELTKTGLYSYYSNGNSLGHDPNTIITKTGTKSGTNGYYRCRRCGTEYGHWNNAVDEPAESSGGGGGCPAGGAHQYDEWITNADGTGQYRCSKCHGG